MSIFEQVQAARAGTEPALICQVPSGWVVLCTLQFLRGYSILMPDPVAPSLNDLSQAQRAQYLCDMTLVGDALLEVTGANRINYAIMGNTDPVLHAHIVPRYRDEPEAWRSGLPWSYPDEVVEGKKFDYRRDWELMHKIAVAIRGHIS
jgi:diadenosine tetraphosphate (Ap4A) HIT family hydrolase